MTSIFARLRQYRISPVLGGAAVAMAVSGLAACQGVSMGQKRAATAIMMPSSQSNVKGTVHFQSMKDRLKVEVKFNGLLPNSVHGFHVHANGDCSAPDASSAGGHFDPTNQMHQNGTEHHAGDLPNLVANQYGQINTVMYVKGLTIKAGELSDIQGRSVVLHAAPDDYQSQPAGNAGQRIACGVIRVS